MDNKKLCIRSVPPIASAYTAEKVLEELRKDLDGATAVRLLKKGWIQVEFTSHRNAALARRKLVRGDVVLFQSRNIIREVDWAAPDMEDYLNNLQRKKTISVRNLPGNITKQRISRAFNFLSGGGGKVENVAINSTTHCALVTFTSAKDAKSVLDRGSNLELEGQRAELTWLGAENEKEEIKKKKEEEEEKKKKKEEEEKKKKKKKKKKEKKKLIFFFFFF